MAENTASVKITEDVPKTSRNRKFYTWHKKKLIYDSQEILIFYFIFKYVNYHNYPDTCLNKITH